MAGDHHGMHKSSQFPIIDTLIKNCLKLSSTTSDAGAIQRTCEAIARLVPDAKPEYISHRLNKLSGYTEKKVEHPGSEADVQSYVYSLLEENPKNQSNDSSEPGKLNFQPSGRFQMDTLSAALNILQNKESYNDEVASPNMVIHVCDEAKNLKQDFDCPRDLLVQEMRYFAEYLSVDSQRLEEVDISVHCDIHIFDWLMRYVKRGTKLIDESEVPKLDPNNVISILISSDFLKMESLVEACILYCHKNMSVIVSTPCNMNCVNEKLTGLIAEKFSHNELEEIKDRKDKFKSKLFCKKIEKLFSQNATNPDSPGTAGTLFRCSVCQRILTQEQSSKLPCTNNRLSVGGLGGLTYEHEADAAWDVSNYLVSLFEETHKWGLVYWRLWGVVNHLTCARCGLVFQLGDFSNCLYHPERAQYHQMAVGDTSDNPLGLYSCCNQRVLRFDPTGLNKGCRSKEHVVTTTDPMQRKILDDVLQHKNLVRSSLPLCSSLSDLNIFASEESKCSIKEATMTPVEIYSSALPPVPSSGAAMQAHRRSTLRKSPDNDEEDVAGEEDSPSHFLPLTASSVSVAASDSTKANSVAKAKKEKSHIPSDHTTYGRFPSKQRWDVARSVRWNQDMQREEDRRRLTSMSSNLTKQRAPEKSDKTRVKDVKELPGGIFMKLEIAFFNNLKTQGGGQAQGFARSFGAKDFKSKMRR